MNSSLSTPSMFSFASYDTTSQKLIRPSMSSSRESSTARSAHQWMPTSPTPTSSVCLRMRMTPPVLPHWHHISYALSHCQSHGRSPLPQTLQAPPLQFFYQHQQQNELHYQRLPASSRKVHHKPSESWPCSLLLLHLHWLEKHVQ